MSDTTILLLLVVVVGDIGIEFVAIGTVAAEEPIACVLASTIGVEALGITVIEVCP